jgi:UPF0176 protein
MEKSEYKTILFYRYINISPENVSLLKAVLKSVCDVLELKGRILIAREGINGTVEGNPTSIEAFKKHILSYKYFRKMDIKESVTHGSAFPKMKVKIKDEIVSTKYPKHIDPTVKTGRHINAAEVKKMFNKGEEFYVIDMRNDYEIKAGHFKNTVNVDWDMKASRDLPKLVQDLEIYKDKKVLTVCTGGVRCEKMSAYLLDQGFKDVSQLHNGIHTYMQKYPGEDFKGTLYTFDNRMTMDFGGEKREVVGECYVCKEKTEKFGHCAFSMCHAHLLLCDKHLETKNYCNDKCKADDQTMQKRVQDYLSNSIATEQ